MRCIGILSDDVAAAHAALLIGTGLAEAGVRAGVATALPVPARRGLGSDAVLALVHIDQSGEGPLAAAMARCREEDRDLVVALPLTELQDARLLSRLDVAITVGRERAAAARALHAARYVAGDPAPGTSQDLRPSPWFLACSDQGVLRTTASLASLAGPALPVATRVLPTVLPRLDRDIEADLLHRSAPPRCVQAGIVLAAVAVAAAAEPRAARIDAAGLTGLMAGPGTGNGDVGDRLIALAAAYARLVDAHVAERWPPLPASRRRVTAGACCSARDRVRQASCRPVSSERIRSGW
jgi:hypothetical protein